MKKNLLLVAFVFSTLISYSQDETSQPIKGKDWGSKSTRRKASTEIIVTTDDSANLSTKIAIVLLMKDYTFDVRDEKLGIFVTKPHESEKYNFVYKIKVVIKGNVATISGFTDIYRSFNSHLSNDPSMRIEYLGTKVDIRFGWNELMDVANKLNPISIKYK